MEEIKQCPVWFDPYAAWGPPKLIDDEVQALLTVRRSDPDFERKAYEVLTIYGRVVVLEDSQ